MFSSFKLPASVEARLSAVPIHWLVTGGAGFIGSHLVETLLAHGQQVSVIDDFSTGLRENLDDVRRIVGEEAWARCRVVEGSITDLEAVRDAMAGVQVVLHQAALGSVPRSLKDPLASHLANVDGTLHVLIAARDSGVERVVYAGSSSTYGDEPNLPKREDRIGRPLSPYAVTKRVVELYGENFARCYGLPVIGLRYFNVFGPRQRPDGPYAAVIPKWMQALLDGDQCVVNGDGLTSRDFTFVSNVVSANLLAALAPAEVANGDVLNVAAGGRTTLLELFEGIKAGLQAVLPERADLATASLEFGPERLGDVRHSHADVSKAQRLVGYEPLVSVREGLANSARWYARRWAESVSVR